MEKRFKKRLDMGDSFEVLGRKMKQEGCLQR
jgi:hypothetical protein